MRPSSLIVVASFATLLVSFWNRNDLPGNIDYVAQIADEPKQTRTGERAFDVEFNEVGYRIEPEYAYDITGMVVSYRHHNEDNSRMHALANDHLNMLDVCVIWGDNTGNERLDKISFWNGLFTCNVKTRDQQAWDAFDMNQLSNNHLLSDDEFIRRQVKKIRIGDQIRVRGFLASYATEGGSVRGTSTTRTDTGNGACETIYVRTFEIVRAATSYWRIAMWASIALLAVGLTLHFRKPYKPY